jgi:cold shock CspA family protein
LKELFALTTGTIKKLVRDRGFGFIEEPTGQDIFFDELEEGETVEYDAESDTKGRGQRAVNIRLAASQG